MKLINWKNLTGWVIIVVTLFSAYLICYFKNFNLYFLVLLAFEMLLAVRYRKIFTPFMVRTSQFILGILFLFSGFVKAVDPIGTAYRIEDYLIAYGLDYQFWMTIVLSFLLNAAELLLGGLMFLNIKPRLTAWLVVLMMSVFTLTTLYDALYNPVPDCGCFGDALIMTNWQTFYKNLAINVFVIIFVFGRFKLKQVFKTRTEWIVAAALIVFFFGFQYFNFVNLPMFDFRPYRVGNRLTPENPLPVENYLTYRNKITGETKEYLSPNFPYNDPEWLENWEFVSQRIYDPNIIEGMNLAIIDFNGENVTQQIINNPDFQFFVVAWNIEDTDKRAFRKINTLYQKAEDANISFIVLTSSSREEVDEFAAQLNLSEHLVFYNVDDIELKTMVRANPGLMLIRDGLILDKWHNNNLPKWETIERRFLNQP
ncbi:MAG TPA: hypothetical protein PLI65_08265 [Bacteroidales bacterium]|nr:hypothetical protein [Bacteroidales bacterium]HRW97098.1 hypothetical protein [Bacteroidales bacterium]